MSPHVIKLRHTEHILSIYKVWVKKINANLPIYIDRYIGIHLGTV
jgi:hypothetical protein